MLQPSSGGCGGAEPRGSRSRQSSRSSDSLHLAGRLRGGRQVESPGTEPPPCRVLRPPGRSSWIVWPTGCQGVCPYCAFLEDRVTLASSFARASDAGMRGSGGGQDACGFSRYVPNLPGAPLPPLCRGKLLAAARPTLPQTLLLPGPPHLGSLWCSQLAACWGRRLPAGGESSAGQG